jgi:malonyl-CoA O-methyltransferase
MVSRIGTLVRRIYPRRENRPAPVLGSREAYALWSANYPARAHNPLMAAEQQAMMALMPLVAGCAVLDLGCGSGRYGQIALERGARQVIGIDNSLPMLRQAMFPVLAGEMDALPCESGAFDVVICGLAIGHIPLPRMRQALGEIARVLKPGSSALISDFHPFLALTGHQRSFRDAVGQRFAVEHYVHLWSDYFDAARLAGLTVDAVLEPAIDEAPVQGPGVLVIRLQKPSR